MKSINKMFVLAVVCVALFGAGEAPARQEAEDNNTLLLALMEEVLDEVAKKIDTIDPTLGRVAVYRIQADQAWFPPPLRDHFRNRLVEVLRQLDTPKVVTLPELNTLKISSTDTSFTIINALPSPGELWRVSRSLRVDAYFEGNLAYVPDKALMLDLRLNRTGTNEVLWAGSFAAYEQMRMPSNNPFKFSFIGGVEVFPVELEAAAETALRSDFSGKITHQSLYVGVFHYLWEKSRLRYELRVGLSFLNEGVRLSSDQFAGNSFYAEGKDGISAARPVSYNLRSLIYSTLIENRKSATSDWLSFYLSLTRYFTLNMPDVTGLGLGLRTDVGEHFSFSTGFNLIMGQEFLGVPLEQGQVAYKMRINGLQYEIFMLQYTF